MNKITSTFLSAAFLGMTSTIGCNNVDRKNSPVGAPIIKEEKKEATIKEVTDATFESEVLKSKKPVLVYFTAPWCGACRAFEPTVKKVANKYADKLTVLKLDVDKNEKTADKYEISSIPRLYGFVSGKVVFGTQGAGWKFEEVVEEIEKNIFKK